MPIKVRQTPNRDIRSDLKERMLLATANRDEHQKLAKAFDDEVLLLTKLLDQEERRFGSAKAEQVAPTPVSLSSIIVEGLTQDRMDKDGLKQFAEGRGFTVDGRSLHATIINLIRSGKIREVAEGIYGLP